MIDNDEALSHYAAGRADEINLLADLDILVPIEDEALAAEWVRLAASQISVRFGDDVAEEFAALWPELSGK